jgi:acyl-CoA synthetase (AMP-forming)/AMP-acid ligase II
VAVFSDPSIEAVVSIFAALKAGGIFTVINPQVRAKKAGFILNDCQAAALITDPPRYREIAAEVGHCPSLRIIVVKGQRKTERSGTSGTLKPFSLAEVIDRYPAARPEKRCIDVDLASLIYTSGSTGVPKAVMMTHLNMVTAAESITTYLENSADDVILNVMPLSFDYGLYQVLMAFKAGGSVIQEKSFLYPFRTINLLIREKVTGFPIVPAVAAVLFKLKNLRRYRFPHLRYITSTAQALPPKSIRRLREIFPHARIYSMYGMTECKRVSFLPPEYIDRKPTSVGKAMPNTEAYIVDSDGYKINEPGKIGELVVRGSHVMKGYWNRPEETARVLRPGRLPGERLLWTGDLFQMDKEGFLYFVARKDEMIKVAGALVSPKEVENALNEIDGVKEAAVLGVADEITGQAIKAFIVMNEGFRLRADDIRRESAKYLEHYMVPKWVSICRKLPKSAHGKVLKRELAKPGRSSSAG